LATIRPTIVKTLIYLKASSDQRRGARFRLPYRCTIRRSFFSGSFDLNQPELPCVSIFAVCLGDNFT
jgi:hypothetical protein